MGGSAGALDAVLMRGRWAVTKSARHYIQSGRALRCAVELNPQVAAWVQLFGPLFPILFELLLKQ